MCKEQRAKRYAGHELGTGQKTVTVTVVAVNQV